MAKGKTTAFFCKECGYESAKWLGQCPGCREWNSFVEEPVAKAEASSKRGIAKMAADGGTSGKIKPARLSEIQLDEQDRMKTGYEEFDRVLGGGVVKGSLVLVGGDPGIGKSTLLLQVCRNLAFADKKVLYISGEESLKQIKLRANRIGEVKGDLFFLCETNLELIEAAIHEEQPDVVIIDFHPDHVPGRDFLCSRQRQPGAGIHESADADRKGERNCHIYRRACNKRRRSCRSKSVGTYGGHRFIF